MAITVNSLGMGSWRFGSGDERADVVGQHTQGRAAGWKGTPQGMKSRLGRCKPSGTGGRGMVDIINVWRNWKGQIWKSLSFVSFLFLLRFCSISHFVFAPLSTPLFQEKTVGKRKMRQLQKTPTCYCFSPSLANCL